MSNMSISDAPTRLRFVMQILVLMVEIASILVLDITFEENVYVQLDTQV